MTAQNASSNAGSTALGGDAGGGAGAGGAAATGNSGGNEGAANASAQGAGAAGAQGAGTAAGQQGGAQTQGAQGAQDQGKANAPAEIELKPVDGLQLDDKVLGDFKAKAKEFGLDSAKAQGLLEFYAQTQKAAIAAQHASAEKTHAEWVAAMKADKDFGGEKLDASINAARKAVQKFGSPELRTFLNETGLGDHPELLRAFVRIGQAMKEDSIAGGGDAPAGQGQSEDAFLRSMYPNSPQMFSKE